MKLDGVGHITLFGVTCKALLSFRVHILRYCGITVYVQPVVYVHGRNGLRRYEIFTYSQGGTCPPLCIGRSLQILLTPLKAPTWVQLGY